MTQPVTNIRSITDAMGGITSFAYDAAGNKVRAEDALGAKVMFTYDAMGNCINETDPL